MHPSVELSNAIRISLAPAFLLVAMSNLLGHIMTTRQRIIDRYRQLSAEPDVIIAPDEVEYEKRVLRDRVALTNRSINLLTLAVMLIALVIFIIFISLVSPVIDLTLTDAPVCPGDAQSDRCRRALLASAADLLSAAAAHRPVQLGDHQGPEQSPARTVPRA